MIEYREIPLTKGLATKVCEADFQRFGAYKWRTHRCSNGRHYAVRWVKTANGPRKRQFLSREILNLSPEDPRQPDHIDLDGLNNLPSNLRIATKSQNAMNRRRRSDNTSGYKGVTWHKRWNKWQAEICVEGKKKSLGYFQTAEAAYNAYCKEAQDIHGEFARLS